MFANLLLGVVGLVQVTAYTQPQKAVTVTGQVSVLHSDYFKAKKSPTEYRLVDTSHHIYSLVFTSPPPSLVSGSTVTVTGTQQGSTLVVATSTLKTLSVPAPKPPQGNQSTLVLLVNFADQPIQPITTAQAQGIVFTDPTSVNLYYQDTSYGLTWFSGLVSGYYSISLPHTTCDYYAWGQAAEDQAIAAGINVGSYSHVVYAIADNGVCGYYGLSTIGGSPSRSYIFQVGMGTPFVYIHELGHAIGLNHAQLRDCGSVAIADYSACQVITYGDSFDPLSASFVAYRLNSPHKLALGFNTAVPITTTGRYTLTPLTSSTTQVLAIPKPNTSENYYLSYRQPVGSDAALPAGMTNGVSIHTWDSSPDSQTYLLDTTPLTDSIADAALSDSASLCDPLNHLLITQVSHSSSQAVVDINLASSCSLAWHAPDGSPCNFGTRSAGYAIYYTQANCTGTFNYHAQGGDCSATGLGTCYTWYLPSSYMAMAASYQTNGSPTCTNMSPVLNLSEMVHSLTQCVWN